MKKTGPDEDVAAARLAAGLLYANLADYLAAHLLQGLEYMNRVATREYLNSTVVYRAKSSLNLPLERTIKRLEQYDFPSRAELLNLLEEIKKCRNKLAHEMFKVPDLSEIGDAAISLAAKTEELLAEFNAFARNMPPKTLEDWMGEQEKTK